MQSISVALKIWAKTIILNAFFSGAWFVLTGRFLDVFWAMPLLLCGYIVTLPLLGVIIPLVLLSARLPYGIPARMAWLTFYLAGLIILFYLLFSKIEENVFFKIHPWANQLMVTTTGGLLLAVLTTRKSLNKLYATP